MTWGFDKSANDNQGVQISLNALRGQALQRLEGVHQKLEAKGVNPAFAKAARNDALGDSGLMGSLLMSMLTWGAMGAAMGVEHVAATSGTGIRDAFNHLSISVMIEGASILRDEEANDRRARKLDWYPEGRRKCALEAAKMAQKFNLISGQKNASFAFDASAEIACLYEIVDMLDQLEQAGVKTIRAEESDDIYTLLKKTTKDMFKNKGHGLRSFAAPMVMAV